MPQLLTSLEAESDFIHIWQYIAEDSPLNADRFLDYLNSQALKLAHAPQIGTLHLELGPEIRIFPTKNYLLIYKPIPDGILLLRVIHSSIEYTQLF
ncbi:type II toxin-antitoxin system RelE/ParE family toxin [Neptuniibacter sp. QD57_21]|uniref:type II toxin-antitoxin system RelE/ParE family toxin n=1 Tax=Neptuniibacter sp. QD57_21 TaxID=3398213 RepID=UPI0039F46996